VGMEVKNKKADNRSSVVPIEALEADL